MKKLLLTSTFAVVFGLAITACGDDSSSGPEEESSSSVELEDVSSSSEESAESSSNKKSEEGKSSSSYSGEGTPESSEESGDAESSSSEAKKDDSSSSAAVSSSSVSANPFAGRVAAPYCNVDLSESKDSVIFEYGFDEFNQRVTVAWNVKRLYLVGNGPSCDDITLLRYMSTGDDYGMKWENEKKCTTENLTFSAEVFFDEETPEIIKDSWEKLCPDILKNIMPTEYLNPKVKYGNFIDPRDYHVYKTIEIGNQTWMAQNLNYQGVNNGEVLCYGNDGEYCTKYGALYDWTTAQEACPEGWHLPRQDEFELLINHVDPTYSTGNTDESRSETAGEYLKTSSGWRNNENGNDYYGFSALPAGGFFSGVVNDFTNEGSYTYFWSSTEYGAYDGVYRLNLYKKVAVLDWEYKTSNLSVRCVKNSD